MAGGHPGVNETMSDVSGRAENDHLSGMFLLAIHGAMTGPGAGASNFVGLAFWAIIEAPAPFLNNRNRSSGT
jgi:hypothetical protein